MDGFGQVLVTTLARASGASALRMSLKPSNDDQSHGLLDPQKIAPQNAREYRQKAGWHELNPFSIERKLGPLEQRWL
jgi:hypothetical protein